MIFKEILPDLYQIILVNNGLQEDQNSSNINIRNKLQSKPLLYRIWKYLKNTWTGVLTGNGKLCFNFFGSKNGYYFFILVVAHYVCICSKQPSWYILQLIDLSK